MTDSKTKLWMVAPFIVLEGMDGAGTTTQSEAVAARLRSQGRAVYATREPTDTDVGALIRDCLRPAHKRAFVGADKEIPPDAMALLFVADRRIHHRNEIGPVLESGSAVVCDRFQLSTTVYQRAQGCSPHWLRDVSRGIAPPDVTYFLDISLETAMARIGHRAHDRDLFETEEFLDLVRNLYRQEIVDHKIHSGPSLVMIDGELDEEAVTDRIFRDLEERFPFGARPAPAAKA